MQSANSSKPRIAILGGTGKEGPGLAMRWAYAGYSVIIGSRQLEKAVATANELNTLLHLDTIMGLENQEAARQADICVLTVVYTAHQAALEVLRGCLQGKVLVDATARVDFRQPLPPPPPSAARLAQNFLGEEARVVAAFQTVPAHVLRQDPATPLDVDVLVCADDLEAAAQVIDLTKAAGMQAFYAGGLDNAIVVEGLTALLISINKHYKVKTAALHISGLSPSLG